MRRKRSRAEILALVKGKTSLASVLADIAVAGGEVAARLAAVTLNPALGLIGPVLALVSEMLRDDLSVYGFTSETELVATVHAYSEAVGAYGERNVPPTSPLFYLDGAFLDACLLAVSTQPTYREGLNKVLRSLSAMDPDLRPSEGAVEAFFELFTQKRRQEPHLHPSVHAWVLGRRMDEQEGRLDAQEGRLDAQEGRVTSLERAAAPAPPQLAGPLFTHRAVVMDVRTHVARPALVETYRALLEENRMLLLHAPGGIGKTSLAAEMFGAVKGGYRLHGWMAWTDNDRAGMDAWRAAFLGQVATTDTSEKTDYAGVKRLLRSALMDAGGGLLVLDNLPPELDREVLDELSEFAQIGLRVLGIARYPVEARFASRRVPELDEGECVALLERRLVQCGLGRLDAVQRGEAAGIVRWTGQNALLIDMAARAVSAGRMTVAELLAAIREKGIPDWTKVDTEHNPKGKHTPLEHIRFVFRLHGVPTDRQIWYLRQFVVLPYQLVELPLLQEWLDRPEGFYEDIDDMAENGWIEESEDRRGAQMHPVMREFVKVEYPVRFEDCGVLVGNLGEALRASRDDWDGKRRLYPYGHAVGVWFGFVKDQRMLDLQMECTIAANDDYLLEDALLHSTIAVEISIAMYGEDSEHAAPSYNNMAGVYRAMGDYGSALEFQLRALEISENALGAEHPDTATSLNNIATIYQDMGDYGKALDFLLRALAIREKVLGAEHPDTASSLNNIASIYRAMGDYGSALEFYQKALSLFQNKLGDEHPNTIIVKDNMQTLIETMQS